MSSQSRVSHQERRSLTYHWKTCTSKSLECSQKHQRNETFGEKQPCICAHKNSQGCNQSESPAKVVPDWHQHKWRHTLNSHVNSNSEQNKL